MELGLHGSCKQAHPPDGVHRLTFAKIYAGYSSLDITNVTAGARGKLSDRGLSTNRTLLGGQSAAAELSNKSKRVAVVMDIKKYDWVFMTQPGALRRVIMNLFGTFSQSTIKNYTRNLPRELLTSIFGSCRKCFEVYRSWLGAREPRSR